MHYTSTKHPLQMPGLFSLLMGRKRGWWRSALLIFFSFGCLLGNAQPYVNGNLSTGATSSNGTAAPAGFTWSEVQAGNTAAGFVGSVVGGIRLGDDVTVPAGQNWLVSSIVFYGYQTNYTGTTSPFTSVTLRIHAGSPSGPVVFGDLTTNRLLSTTSAGVYRIFNAAPGTTRQVWKVEAAVNFSLPPGTYWLDWQTDVTGSVGHFAPSSTVVGQTTVPGYNAQSFNGTAWNPVLDGTNAMDFPFIVNYTQTTCTGTPVIGDIFSTAPSVCTGRNFTLYTRSSVPGTDIAFQWQSGPSSTGPWTDITGATSFWYTTTMTASSYYRLKATCGANSGFSNPLQVTLAPANTCYCIPPTTICSSGDVITRVQFGGINNQSLCSTNGYGDYSLTVAPASVVSGGTYPLAVTAGNGTLTENLGAWIDYNQNGVFDASEFIPLGSTTGTVTVNVSIPLTATAGQTRMRVRTRSGAALTGADACLAYTNGETEDYLVNIAACVPGSITVQPVNTTGICSDTARISVTATGSLLSYQWEVRTSVAAPWTNVTNGASYSGATTNTLTIINAPPTLNGYQYRVQITGTCTTGLTSDIVTFTVAPLTATVTPSTVSICTGGSPVLMQINTENPLPVTSTFASAGLSLVVPDNTPNGASNNLTVALPAAAIIKNIAVKINMTHTWVGDMVFVLKAPNGQVFNLDYFLSGTGGAAATTAFTNTVISSSGTTLLSAGTNPWTGTFRADAVLTGSPTAPAGPTGFAPTTALWTDLYSVPSGTWTLAMYDGGAGDVGTLLNWSMDITYKQTLTGIFTPSTGLFTNAAGTTPYTGTAVSSVYAAPTSSQTYQLVVSNTLCTSGPISIPVDVSSPITTVTLSSPFNACVGGNTSITATAGAGGITWAWEVSTDGGTTWNPVTNTGVYSGATTNTLTITGATLTLNGYRYRAIATNGCGSVTSTGAQLVVSNPVVPTFNAVTPFCSGATPPVLPTTSNNAITGTWSPATVNNTTTATYTFTPSAGQCATTTTLVVTVNQFATITTQPSNTAGCAGSDVSFSVTATNATAYQWQLSTDGGVTFNDISGATAATLPVTGITAGMNNYQYQVLVFNACGHVTSNVATLSVTTIPPITTQPADQFVCPGNNATFTVVAPGTGITYQWQVSIDGGATFNNVPGATAASLTITGVTAGMNGYQYHVIVTSSCGTNTSSNATLNLTTVPAVTTQPLPATACAGGTASFTVASSGAGLNYQWQVSTDGGSTFTNVSGATSATLTLSSLTLGMNNNQYQATVSNGCGTVTSNAATLTVNNAVAITTQPANQSSCSGSNATFSVVATGTGITYQWQVSTDGGTTFNDIPAATSASYTVVSPAGAQNGNVYHVVLTVACGSVTSSNATLTVGTTPAITTQPAAASGCPGGSVTFTGAASGSATYQWEVSTNGGVTYTPVAGATSATLTVSALTAGMNNNLYHLVASNSCGTVTSSSALLTVNSAVSITTQPTSQTGCVGSPVTFTAAATGTGVTYQWQVSTDNGATWNNIPTATTPALTIPSVSAAMNGTQYRVMVMGTCTTTAIASNAATLTVFSVSTAPPAIVNACEGESVTLTVTAAGAGLTYQWHVSTNGGTSYTDIAGATGASLVLNNLTMAADGNLYTVTVVSGTCSVTTTPSELVVNEKPVVTLDFAPGSTTLMVATVTPGSGSYTYSWTLNNVPVTATSGTLDVSVNGVGVYTVTATDVNTGCSSTSADFTVTQRSGILIVYPNPNQGSFNVLYNQNIIGPVQRFMTIYDSKGALVMSRTFMLASASEAMSVSLPTLSGGIYMVMVRDKNGFLIGTERVLIK